ncbi:phosphoglycerate mutase family protein [Euzebya tangerina]|uniref:phosphoglycerate mutase family protein n=1 Tax=Euzebya tangerina TaxID=591198 RepID=UPI000E31F072|nr:histidine phosphatase family protein [Euzebya tangerina]
MKTTIELVRHAKAHSRDRWWGRPDRERPLTDTGMDQARALAAALPDSGPPIAKLFSSPWVRCTQTLDPLADAMGVHVVDAEELGEVVNLPVHDGGDAWVTSAWLGGRAVSFIDQLVASYGEKRVVCCSHGDVIPALVAVLVGRDSLDLTDVRCKKAARFTLTFTDTVCTDVIYHPPAR